MAMVIEIISCFIPVPATQLSPIYREQPSLVPPGDRPFPVTGLLVATADFNGDGKPDYVLYNGDTRQTAIWYLNNNVFVSSAFGPTLPSGWSLVEQ